MTMTTINKQENATKFDSKKHFSEKDKVRIGQHEVGGMVCQDGSFKLFRLRSNPHLTEWTK